MVYNIDVKRVVDGDTVDVLIHLGFDIHLEKRIRLFGIDTPESRTSDQVEKIYGKMAKNALINWVTKNLDDDEHQPEVELHIYDEDDEGKYGRTLGEIWVDDTNVNQWLVDNHYAVKYHGQSKDDIKEEHIKNREILDKME